AAASLEDVADDVVVVTSGAHRELHGRLVAEGDHRLLPAGVTLLFADEPTDGHGAANTYMHGYSANVHATLRAHYGSRGPDTIEFADYLAEGFVTIQARHTAASWLDETLVCVRLHTTAEMCAVLDGRLGDDFETRALIDAERYCLRHADRLLWSGGDVYETYQRFYGAENLAPGVRIRDAFLHDPDAVRTGEARTPLVGSDRHVRLLYAGRMERRKGVQNLLRALDRLGPRGDWSLTLLGGDTATGPTGTSLKDNLELSSEGDVRITFAEPVPRAEVPSLIRHHDVVVIPSLWECWPNVGREALMQGRPILATPVGGLMDMAIPGRSGWLADGSDVTSLIRALESLLDAREEIDRVIASGGPRQVFEQLTDAQALKDGYRALGASTTARQEAAVAGPLAPGDRVVSVIVPYYELETHLLETIESVERQTYPYIETIVVNDGSLREKDAILYDLAESGRITLVTQANSGLGVARNTGIAASTGAFVLPLDADDLIAPEFVERCVRALRASPDLAYVTSWVQYMDEDGEFYGDALDGYLPYGNWSPLIHRNNLAGTCTSLFRRRVFERGFGYSPDLVSYEDWLLYWQLHDSGLFGAVIPERLFHYRLRRRSMTRRDGAALAGVIHEEMRALARESQVRWTRI
ncbi:MAG: glycosyl transferase group 1, partial [Frankiales bacterium]|nr:glycosyl transferase group 1 [Frankiales bacterium]